MHFRMTSALFVVPAMLFSVRPAAAQSIPPGPEPLQSSAEKRAATAKLQELLKNRNAGTVLPPTPSTNDTRNTLQSWQSLLRQHQQDGSLTVRILPTNDAPNCAHIIVYEASETDLEMILGSSKKPPADLGPRESTDGMPTFKGLPPCSRDLRPAVGTILLPRRNSFVQPPFVLKPSDQGPADQPKKSDAPTPKP